MGMFDNVMVCDSQRLDVRGNIRNEGSADKEGNTHYEVYEDNEGN